MYVSGYQHHPTSFANLSLASGHEIIGDLNRRADRLAPRFSDECGDSSCTNLRPGDDQPRRQQCWDLHAEALAWNAIADHAELVDAAKAFARKGLAYEAGWDWGVYWVKAEDGTFVEYVERDAAIRRAYEAAGLPWTASGGKVWPSGSEYDANCPACVHGAPHTHDAPQDEGCICPGDAFDPFCPVHQEARQDAEDALDAHPDLRCPECDTYSGTFTLDSNGEVIHSTCGRSGSLASFTRGTTEYDAVYDHQEGDDDGETAATALNLAGLSPQAWVDLAPHLSCQEAEVVKAFLLAWKDDWTAQVFIEAHSNSDDDESDLHYQGGAAD